MDGFNNAEEALGDFIDDFTDDVDANGDTEEDRLEDDPSEDDQGEAEDEAGEDDDAESEDEPEEPEVPPVKAPESWSKEDAAIFAQLPKEAQEVIQRRETERDRFVRAKALEASQTRDKVANEAREIIVKLHDENAQKLTAYASMIMPQRPDQRLLYTGDQNDIVTYHRQQAAYEAASDQLQQLQHQISQSQEAANAAREQSHQAEIASDAQRLREQLPEWFEEGSTIQSELRTIGDALGYPPELMQQASSTDILALKKAYDWKVKADKYDKAIGKQMEAVRAAKGLPKMAKPGAAPSKQQKSAVGREKAWERVKASNGKDGTAIADFLGL